LGRIAAAGCLLAIYLTIGIGDARSDDPTVLDVGDTIILARSFIDCTVERHPGTRRKLVICYRLPTAKYEPYAGGMDETGATMVERFDPKSRMHPLFYRGVDGAGFVQTPLSFHVKASIVIKSTFVVTGTSITCLYHIDGEKRFVACADKVDADIVPRPGAHGFYMDETDLVKAVDFDATAKRRDLYSIGKKGRDQPRALSLSDGDGLGLYGSGARCSRIASAVSCGFYASGLAPVAGSYRVSLATGGVTVERIGTGGRGRVVRGRGPAPARRPSGLSSFYAGDGAERVRLPGTNRACVTRPPKPTAAIECGTYRGGAPLPATQTIGIDGRGRVSVWRMRSGGRRTLLFRVTGKSR
jgi:hypothetical protein